MSAPPPWLSILALAMSLNAQPSLLEKRAIRAARQISVSKLEVGLPNQKFGRWFAQTIGAGAAIQWEVNDCGEQTGDPRVDHARDMPLCASATGNLADGRVARVSIAVGSWQKGVAGSPALYMAIIEKNKQLDFFRKLSDFADRLRKPK